MPLFSLVTPQKRKNTSCLAKNFQVFVEGATVGSVSNCILALRWQVNLANVSFISRKDK